MAASAESALKGLLKDESTADEAIARLEEAGYSITPPSGEDTSEGGEADGPMPEKEDTEEGPGILAIGMSAGKPEDKEEEEDNETKDGKRESAAKKAMSSHGYKF
jgi:hypothetical protein